jgi:hypothetical protein
MHAQLPYVEVLLSLVCSHAGDKGGVLVKPLAAGGDGAAGWHAACEGSNWSCTTESPDRYAFLYDVA